MRRVLAPVLLLALAVPATSALAKPTALTCYEEHGLSSLKDYVNCIHPIMPRSGDRWPVHCVTDNTTVGPGPSVQVELYWAITCVAPIIP